LTTYFLGSKFPFFSSKDIFLNGQNESIKGLRKRYYINNVWGIRNQFYTYIQYFTLIPNFNPQFLNVFFNFYFFLVFYQDWLIPLTKSPINNIKTFLYYSFANGAIGVIFFVFVFFQYLPEKPQARLNGNISVFSSIISQENVDVMRPKVGRKSLTISQDCWIFCPRGRESPLQHTGWSKPH